MKALFALVWHEIRERRAMLAAAAIIALGIPLVTPLLPGTGSNPSEDVREILMWFAVGFVIPVFALLMGASFIGSDLSEGRAGFFFAQPLSGPTIWFGKLAAAAAVIWATQVIIMLPTAVLSGEAGRILAARGLFLEPIGEWASSVVFWLGPFAVILLAHALGIVWRARSVWIVADVIALVLLIAAVRLIKAPFLQVFAAHVLVALTGWLVFMILVGLLAAGAAQVIVGRVDVRRGHRALSAVLWSVLAVALTAAAVWGWWVRSASPSDLTRVSEVSVGSGEWIAVTGSSLGRLDYYPGFIVNTANGRSVPAHSGSNIYERGLAFSADQGLAVWTEPDGFEETDLVRVYLNDPDLRPERTGIVVDRHWRDLIVSPDGRRVGLIEDGKITVYDLESAQLVAAAQPTDGFSPVRIRFVDAETLEVLSWLKESTVGEEGTTRRRWKQHRLSLTTRRLDAGEEIDGTWQWWGGPLDRRLRNKLEKRDVDDKEHLLLTEPSTGETIADLGELPTRWSDVRVSADGVIVIAREKLEGKSLEIFDENGDSIRRIELSDPGWLRLGGEAAPGRLAVGLVVWPEEADQPARRTTKVIDLASGEIVETLEGVSPVLGRWGIQVSSGAWEAGSVASRLLEGTRASLHLWHPDTGELEQVIPIPD